MTESTSRLEQRAYARFRAAVIDFSDAPTAANLARYLAASRALDESRTPRPAGARSSDLARARSV